jgi:hypothetical protein
MKKASETRALRLLSVVCKLMQRDAALMMMFARLVLAMGPGLFVIALDDRRV